LVSSFHGHYELLRESREHDDDQNKRQLENVDAVVYLTERHVETLDRYGVPDCKRRKIFYGVPFQLEKSSTKYQSNEQLRLVMAGRGIPEKGWAETLEAVVDINRELGDEITIDLLGVGEELDKLREKYQEREFVHFLGYCDDILPIVKQAHIGLLPSYYTAESLPNTIIEYLVCGKPVIATDIGAIREMLTHDGEVAGAILPPHDGKVLSVQIKSALVEYLSNKSKVEHDSSIALRAAQKFQMKICTANHLCLYDSLLPPNK
jgi:glycosyltransferase involved in cell wall biosynthesis